MKYLTEGCLSSVLRLEAPKPRYLGTHYLDDVVFISFPPCCAIALYLAKSSRMPSDKGRSWCKPTSPVTTGSRWALSPPSKRSSTT
jgi:hypothetical protein